ncbi:hypothetical protein Tco_0953298 [Tanacetum coccineum]|uniref:Uncharacterized protein n=1 Tax=Tanacetum coccineum TaxID=301880 RepID=A0ABQ5E1C7_9ASTR
MSMKPLKKLLTSLFKLQSVHASESYLTLEASIDRENRDEFLKAKAKSSQQSSAWKTSDTREAPSSSSKQKFVPQSKQPIKDVPVPDDLNILDSEDIGSAHIPKIKTRPDWLKPANAFATSYQDPEENKILQKTGDMGSFIKWYCRQIGKSKLSKTDLEGPAYKVVREFHSNNISLQFQMEECHLLLTNQIDLVNPEGSKERRNALSISKLKAAYYPDFGLEELVPSLWIESEREYDISAAYEIVLRRADYKEYKISEADFKNLHPNDFEDMYLLHLQGKLNHLSSADKVHLFNAVNLPKPNRNKIASPPPNTGSPIISSGDGKPTEDLFLEYIDSDLDFKAPLNDVVERVSGSNNEDDVEEENRLEGFLLRL